MPGALLPAHRSVRSKSPYVHLLFPYFSLTVSPLLTRGYGPRDRLIRVVRFACPAWGRGGSGARNKTKEWWVSDMQGLHRQRFTAVGLGLAATALFVAACGSSGG